MFLFNTLLLFLTGPHFTYTIENLASGLRYGLSIKYKPDLENLEQKK